MITSQHKPRDVLIFVLLQLKYWYKLYVCTQRKKNYKYKSVCFVFLSSQNGETDRRDSLHRFSYKGQKVTGS